VRENRQHGSEGGEVEFDRHKLAPLSVNFK